MEIADFLDWADISSAITTLLTEAGPYVLGAFGITLAVSLGMAFLGRVKRTVVSAVK